MENKVSVRACFAGCNIKSGKCVLQFELDLKHKDAIPQLALMTGTFVTLDLTSDQTVLFKESEKENEEPELYVDDEEHMLPEPILEYEYDDDEAA